MISVTAHVTPEKLAGFVPFANERLRAVVDEGRQAGEHYMSSIVPHGQSNRLAASVVSSIFSVTDAHHIGSVGIDRSIAPYAGDVDKGTGVDGPFRMPVTVTRPARRPTTSRFGTRTHMNGVMRFQKNGEPPRYRKTVKMRPSVKIERGKNFSGRTQNYLVDWTRLRTSVLARELTLYFANDHHTT